MKLTTNNYFDQVAQYMDIINADADFKSTYAFINKATKNGKDLSVLDESPEIEETFELLIESLNKVAGKQSKSASKSGAKKPASPKSAVRKTDERTKRKPAKEKTAAKAVKTPPKGKEPEHDAEKVEHIPSDIALVKKYIGLHSKQKTYDQVLSVWRAFNKAIVERKVTKDSPYKKEIAAMNSSLKSAIPVALSAGSLELEIVPAKLKAYKAIAESVEKSAGVSILMEFVNISGKRGMQERADKLLRRIEKAGAAGKLDGDRYLKDIEKAKHELDAYMNKETDVIGLNDYSLSGISEVAVFGCTCDKELSGFTRSQNAVIFKLIQEKVKNLQDCELDRAFSDTVAPSLCKTIAQKLIDSRQLTMALLRNPARVVGSNTSLAGAGRNYAFDFDTEVMDMRLRNAGLQDKNGDTGKGHILGLSGVVPAPSYGTAQEEVKIISAVDMMQLKFRTLGLQGRYRKLIGDPEPGFSAMIYGKPKQWKSTVAIDFAKELTRYGKVLYCVYEEGHSKLLQDKIDRNKANVPGLDFANKLPADLSPYRFVFIDSVSDARLSEDDFGHLKKLYKPKETSIIGIFHATKDGKFRGGQTFAHDVDIMIRLDEGIAYAQGRYAPPGEMSIFELVPNRPAQAA